MAKHSALAKILAFWLVFAIFIAKLIVTGCQHMAVNDAIYVYHMDCIREDREYIVDYDAREDFNDTMFRLWDWSNKRILSEEDDLVIRPYIGEEIDEWVLKQNWS